MLSAAVVIATVLLLLVALVPDRLAAAGWPRRAPVSGLLLWQALGLTGGLLAVETAVTVALAPSGDTHEAAVRVLLRGDARLPWWAAVAALLSVLLVGRLLSVLVASAARTLRARRSHRVLVDLVATRNPLLARARVIDHDLPLAYCLPGLRPRVVVSRGVLDLLREDEVRAVLAHEDAHLQQRHDLVVLPFLALGATFPRLRAVRTASTSVALLIEMLADDGATRRHPPAVLARALYKVGAGRVPAGGLGVGGRVRDGVGGRVRDGVGGRVGDGVGGDGIVLRAARLVTPPPPLGRLSLVLVTATTGLVLALPVLGLLLPLAIS